MVMRFSYISLGFLVQMRLNVGATCGKLLARLAIFGAAVLSLQRAISRFRQYKKIAVCKMVDLKTMLLLQYGGWWCLKVLVYWECKLARL